MPSLDVLNTSNKKISTVTVSAKVFNAKVNQSLMKQAVRIFLSNQRQSPAKTKSRGEIKATKKKVWRQKGTGRARHGSRNAPIFVGGAKAHGPSGEQNFKLKINKKMKQKSLFSALTTQFKDKNIFIVEGLDKLNPKTKEFNQVFQKLVKNPKKLLFIFSQSASPTDKSIDSIKRGTNNLPFLNTIPAKNLNTYFTLNANKLIFTKKSIKTLEAHYVK
jgi:large subunit ribosomal protein L4